MNSWLVRAVTRQGINKRVWLKLINKKHNMLRSLVSGGKLYNQLMHLVDKIITILKTLQLFAVSAALRRLSQWGKRREFILANWWKRLHPCKANLVIFPLAASRRRQLCCSCQYQSPQCPTAASQSSRWSKAKGSLWRRYSSVLSA